jgi:hypothetical protein
MLEPLHVPLQLRQFPRRVVGLHCFQEKTGEVADAVADLGVDLAAPDLVDRLAKKGDHLGGVRQPDVDEGLRRWRRGVGH